jgi:recombinational DNA repair protein RecT
MTQKTNSDTAIVNYIDNVKGSLSRFLDPGVNYGQFQRDVLLAISENAGLQKCIEKPEGRTSLYHALRRAASKGLSLNPQDQEAALICYGGNKVEYRIMKAGKIAEWEGKQHLLRTGIVREKDYWEEKNDGKDGFWYSHIKARRKRGAVDGYYAAVILKNGYKCVEYMSVDDVLEHAQKYCTSKDVRMLLGRIDPDNFKESLEKINADKSVKWEHKDSNWIKSFDGMAEKTVIHALYRRLHVGDDPESVGENIQPEGEIIDCEFASEPTLTEALKEKLDAQPVETDEDLERQAIQDESQVDMFGNPE